METSKHTAPPVDLDRLVRADSAGIWQLTDNMGNQKTVEVVNDPWGNTQDTHSRLYVRGKGDGYWPVDSSIFDGWKWSRPNAGVLAHADEKTN